MRLLRTSMEYKQQILEYKSEFMENGDDLAGTSYLEIANKSCSLRFQHL